MGVKKGSIALFAGLFAAWARAQGEAGESGRARMEATAGSE